MERRPLFVQLHLHFGTLLLALGLYSVATRAQDASNLIVGASEGQIKQEVSFTFLHIERFPSLIIVRLHTNESSRKEERDKMSRMYKGSSGSTQHTSRRCTIDRHILTAGSLLQGRSLGS